MPIDPNRISRDIERIAACNEATPQVGYSRPTFSKAWREAVNYVIAAANAIGCVIRVDAAGNIHARPGYLTEQQPAWLSGSHIDSVPTGGKFDGVVGIVVALEALRAAAEDQTKIDLELVIFAEEEGTTFGLGMLGSRGWVGDLTAKQLGTVHNSSGQSYLEAGKPCGVRGDALASEEFNRRKYIGFIEAHIEQGPSLWKQEKPMAIVTAIAGRMQFLVSFAGVANHAGSTSMLDRHDALVATAHVIAHIETMARELSDQTVATVGRINCLPNAVNVIPDRVEFTIDFRSPDESVLAEGDRRIRTAVADLAKKRGLRSEVRLTENQPAVAMDAEICQRLAGFAPGAPKTISGALHDAAILAPHLPTAMIFVASKDGISHNPAEFSRIEDIAAAARLLYDAVQSSR